VSRSGLATRPADRHPPSVNLLSPLALDALAARRLRRRFGAGALVLLLALLAIWGAQHIRVVRAQQVLAVEQAETARLTRDTTALAPVRTFITSVDQRKQLVADTMAEEIYFSRVLDALADATPTGADVESVSVSLAPAQATPTAPAPAEDGAEADAEGSTPAAPAVESPCPGPDPFNTRRVVGCIQLTGTADSRASVGSFVIALGADDQFVEPFISTTTTADEQVVTFTGSVGLSEKVYSGRYSRIDRLLRSGGVQ
jgi:hypothetical protein